MVVPVDFGVETLMNHNSLPISGLEDVSVQLYNMQLGFSGLVERELTSLSPLSLALLYGAGLLTALSPCSVSLLPLTLAYLGSGSEEGVEGSPGGGIGAVEKSAYYAVGFSVALSLLALVAILGGQLFGFAFSSTGIPPDATSIFTALLTAIMGLSVLEIINIKFPSLPDSSLLSGQDASERLQPLLLGGSAALIASPCASPVLASLLAILASNSSNISPLFGLVLLLSYSGGYTTPIVFAGAVSKKISAVSKTNGFQWVNYALGMSLVAFGTYNLLDSSARTVFYLIA
jgi:cytochrome c-type biogenesis protein